MADTDSGAATNVDAQPQPQPQPAASSSSTPAQSVHHTPLAHILPEFVPEQWTVTFPQEEAEAGDAQADGSAAAAAAAGGSSSAPPPQNGIDNSAAARIWRHPPSLLVTRINLTPLMLRVDKFLSAAECAEVLRLAYDPEAPAWKPYRNVTYKPEVDGSGAVVAQKFEVGYSEAATLFQLDYGHFGAIHPLIQLFADRVARVVNSTRDYTSNMRRLLRYKPGQKFDLHADDYDRLTPLHRGRRNLTCLIYVHTEPDETGGGTVFPLLDSGSYRSAPVSGSMLIFRNFDPANSFKFDPRCQHYAETTTKGSKYAINLYFVEKEGMWWH